MVEKELRLEWFDDAPRDLPPGVRALADQTEAAAAVGSRVMGSLAVDLGARIESYMSPVVSRIIKRTFEAAEATGQIDTCGHLRQPEPAFWLPYPPYLLRCVRCFDRRINEAKGTEEDRRCDGCLVVAAPDDPPSMYPVAVLMPSILLHDKVEPWLSRGQGPVMMPLGLCPRCKDEHDREEARHER